MEAGRRSGAGALDGGHQALQLLFAEAFEEELHLHLTPAGRRRNLLLLVVIGGGILVVLVLCGGLGPEQGLRPPQALDQGVASRRAKHEHE